MGGVEALQVPLDRLSNLEEGLTQACGEEDSIELGPRRLRGDFCCFVCFICMYLTFESRRMHSCFNFIIQMFSTRWRDGRICNLFGHLQRVGVH
jgi:hypothetical protein